MGARRARARPDDGGRRALPRRRRCLLTGGCGGAPGCERLLEVLADPAYPEHAELAGWLGRPFDPAVFDPHRADAAMQRAAGR